MDAKSFTQVVEENQEFLQQLSRLLLKLSPQVYSAMQDPFPKGGIGKHVRHVLEHYTAVLTGAEAAGTGIVDYDSRTRDADLETTIELARSFIESLVQQLEGLKNRTHAGLSLKVAYTNSTGADSEVVYMPSTVMRELVFVASHTVHHLALIDVIARVQGVQPPVDFGVALSTLRHLQQAS